ncbi:MAG: dTDP-4-dehydrorhamnose 3,5-epimerase [Bosea sp. (in: a-proteobacteria)]
MIFTATDLAGVVLVDLEPRGDERGFFARAFCAEEFEKAGVASQFAQINTSLTARKGTLRGFHYQLPPAAEVKVVRCVRGALLDVALDLRPNSPTFGRSFAAELNAENRRMLVVPRGCAHAFLTLTDDVEALYLVSAPYAPALERGLRWNDPWASVDWPVRPAEISAKDAAWPDFDPDYHGVALFGTAPIAASAHHSRELA